MPICAGVAGAVARDSVLSFGGSVRCGHGPYAEPLGSDDTLATEGDVVHLSAE
jgi:hypothetical protein